VQIRSGLVLTNLHCAGSGTKNHVVHFGPHASISAGYLAGSWWCPAAEIHPPAAAAGRNKRRLDFAVLSYKPGSLPSIYAGAVAELDPGVRPLLGQRLARGDTAPVRLVQISNSATIPSFTPGQRFVANTCRLYAPDEIASHGPYCPGDPVHPAMSGGGISHSCFTDKGSSGAPLFDAREPVVVALHRAFGGWPLPGTVAIMRRDANPRRCAVPAHVIRERLEAWKLL
jgi:hypothetical protein